MAERLETLMNPSGEGQQDAFTQKMRDELGFVGAKRLEDGTYVGLQPLLFTLAICIGVGVYTPFVRRYCYENGPDCLHAYQILATGDDIPEGWIAKRPA